VYFILFSVCILFYLVCVFYFILSIVCILFHN